MENKSQVSKYKIFNYILRLKPTLVYGKLQKQNEKLDFVYMRLNTHNIQIQITQSHQSQLIYAASWFECVDFRQLTNQPEFVNQFCCPNRFVGGTMVKAFAFGGGVTYMWMRNYFIHSKIGKWLVLVYAECVGIQHLLAKAEIFPIVLTVSGLNNIEFEV